MPKAVIGLDLSLDATGLVVFQSPQDPVYWATIEPPACLLPIDRIRYTGGVVRLVAGIFRVTEAAIEDYAYSLLGRSNATSHLSENAGVVKAALLDMGIAVHIYSISAIKSYATGSGQASKEMMAAAFKKMTRKTKDVSEHVIDAYWIGQCHYAQKEMKNPLRKTAGARTD